jgi:hypothetical protein
MSQKSAGLSLNAIAGTVNLPGAARVDLLDAVVCALKDLR